ENMKQLEEQAALQRQFNVGSEVIERDKLSDIIPEINTHDLAGGIYSGKDGYLDPYSVMQGYMKKAKQIGATYIYEEVKEITKNGRNVSGVITEMDVYKALIVIPFAGKREPKL